MRRPLSVCGTDQEALKALLALHATPDPRILDCTFNRGRMWKGLSYRPHRLDRDPALFESGYTDTVADFRRLPFGPASWDVLVFDPPHITSNGAAFKNVKDHAGRPASRWTESFGTGAADLASSDDIVALFAPFLAEARRVLEPGAGIVLAKISDQIHRGAFRWQHIDLILAAREAGFTPCDLMIRVAMTRGNMIDPKWRRVCHTRAVHSFWVVLRNGPDCVSRTAPRADIKPATEAMFA